MRMEITLNLSKYVSLSSPEYEQIEYSGTNGTYVSRQPDNLAVLSILALCKELGIETKASKLHLTLMYSLNVVSVSTGSRLRSDLPVFALGTHVKHWVGHDSKTYVVLALSSTDLCMEHSRIARFGLIPTFIPYEPHITLLAVEELPDGLVEKIDEINKKLNTDPIELRLINQTVSDVK
jgi:hypothetical protein